MTKDTSTPKRAVDYGLPTYFDMQAKMGHTKHLGGRKATDDLAVLCQIGPEQTILNVGSGSGISATYLAQTYGCKVVGVDILPGMVESAQKWARDKGFSDLLEFRLADARDLHFEDNHFDAVISESVTTFIPEREKAMTEYVRVAKPGGYIGFNEAIWIKEPSEAMAEIIIETTNQEFKSQQIWENLFRDAGLIDLVAESYPIKMQDEARNQKGLLSLGDYLRIFGKVIVLLFKDAETRGLVKYVGSNPRQYFEYMGYGLFVGRKPKSI
jgi:ubiquinone/menaquinone biosynthesis C-methylase UbiE